MANRIANSSYMYVRNLLLRIYTDTVQYEIVVKLRLRSSSCNLPEVLGSELDLIVYIAVARGQIAPLYIDM